MTLTAVRQHTVSRIDERRRPIHPTRTITERFLLDGTSAAEFGETFHPALDITTTHDKDRRLYRVYLTRVNVGTISVCWRSDSGAGMPESGRGFAEPSPRYSAAALERIHGEALAHFRPHLPELLEWAAEEIEHL